MAVRRSSSRQSSTSENACNLCCQETDAWAVGQCDHALCLPCSARLRVLCEQKECPVCRLSSAKVAVMTKLTPFSLIKPQSFIEYYKKQYGFLFETQSLLSKFHVLLSYHCTKCEKKQIMASWATLKDHVRKEHDLFYCNICVNKLKLFPCEQKTYTRQELNQHEREGDSDDKSRKGHPLCEFCSVRYLDNEALFEHLKKDHFSCHFCDADGKQDYYPNYAHLKMHFRKAHYLCEQGDCYYEKFTTVFRTKIDLQAHKSKVHKKGLSKAEAKQLRQVDVGFTYARAGGEAGSEEHKRHQHNHRISEMEQLEIAKAMSLEEQNKSSQKKEDGHHHGNKTPPTVEKNEATANNKEQPRNGKSSDSSVANNKKAARKRKPPPGLAPTDTSDTVSTIHVTTSDNTRNGPSLEVSTTKLSPPPGLDSQTNRSDGRVTEELDVFVVAQRLLSYDGEKVNEFQKQCGLYLRDDITVRDYYSACAELFGSSWSNFGLKLAETIPNDTKRYELKELLLSRDSLVVSTYKQKKPPPGFESAKKSTKKRSKEAQNSGPWQPTTNTYAASATAVLNSADFPSLRSESTVAMPPQPKVPVSEPGWDISEADFPCLGTGPMPKPVLPPPGWNVKVSVK